MGGLRHSILIPMTRPKAVLDALKSKLGSQEPSLGSQRDAFGFPIDQSGRQAKVLKHHFRVLGILAPSKRQTRFHCYGQCFRGVGHHIMHLWRQQSMFKVPWAFQIVSQGRQGPLQDVLEEAPGVARATLRVLWEDLDTPF